MQDVYIYGENSITLLGTDSKTNSSTYLIQLNLQPTLMGVSNDLIEVTSYSENVNGEARNVAVKSPRETNLLMIKAEKLNADSIVKCIKKLKSSSLCVSSSRKVAALLAASKNRVKIFELEVDEEDEEVMDENDAESVAENEESLSGAEANQAKNFNCSYQASDTDEFNMPSNKLIPGENAMKANIVYKQFGKHQSAGSTCSIATSICSSTAATIGSVSTNVNYDSASTSSLLRGKRKKNFDYDEDEDDDSEENLLNENNSEMSNMNCSKQPNTNNIEIIANQNGNQSINLQRDNQPETI